MEEEDERERLKIREYLKSFPVGYRFCPTDEELVTHYLVNKVEKKLLPPNNIRPVNLYQYSPQDLSVMYGQEWEGCMYFFTPRDRKYPNGNRPNRAAGNGFWKATGVDTVIGAKEKPIGYRKALVYYQGRSKDTPTKTDWIMHEYTIKQKNPPSSSTTPSDKRLQKANTTPPNMKLDDWVLCKVYKKSQKLHRNNQSAGSNNIGSPTTYVPPPQTNYNVPGVVGPTSSVFPLQTNYNVPGVVGPTSCVFPLQTNYNVPDAVGSTTSVQRNCNVPHLAGSTSSVPPLQTYCNAPNAVGSTGSAPPSQRYCHGPHVDGSTSSVPPSQSYCNVPNNIDSSSSLVPYTNNMTDHQLYRVDLPTFSEEVYKKFKRGQQDDVEAGYIRSAVVSEIYEPPILQSSTCIVPAELPIDRHSHAMSSTSNLQMTIYNNGPNGFPVAQDTFLQNGGYDEVQPWMNNYQHQHPGLNNEDFPDPMPLQVEEMKHTVNEPSVVDQQSYWQEFLSSNENLPLLEYPKPPDDKVLV